MSFTAAICPCCSANIEVPRGQDRCFCAYCGSQILTEAAVAFAKVRVEGLVQTRAADFVIEAGVLREYHGESADVVIPDGVESIGTHSFGTYALEFNSSGKNPDIPAKAIRSVVIPPSVEYIGNEAFSQCHQLRRVDLPDSLKGIGYGAFYGCSSLQEIRIPASVKEVGNSAFSQCTRLQSVKLEEGLKVVGHSAFSECSALVEISFPTTVEEISDFAFYKCSNLSKVSINEGISTIGKLAFFGCALKSVYIPSSVTKLGDAAFGECSSLEQIDGYRDSFLQGYVDGTVVSSSGNPFRNTPFSDRIIAERAAERDKQVERWKNKGCCQHCGGFIRGIRTRKCVACGREKDY